MHSPLLIAIIAGLGGMLGWGLADFFAKKTIDEIGDVTTLFWGQLIGIIPLLIIFLFSPILPNLNGGRLPWIIVLGIWSGLSYIPTYIAFGKGKVSLLSPIFATFAVWVTIISAVFFKEIIPFDRWISFGVVFLGVLLITGNIKENLSLINNREGGSEVKGLKEILFATILYSLWFISLDRFISGNYWVPILLIIRILSTISIFFYAKIRKIKLTFRDRSLWKFLLFIGLFDILAFGSVSYGFSSTSYISIVAILSGAFSLPTIIFANIFLKEKISQIQAIGALTIILGIALLYLL